jgi:hypothetical protein
MAIAHPDDPAGQLASLHYPISRAAYLEYALVHYDGNNRAKIGDLLKVEVDSSRTHMIWENRVLLSLALSYQLGPADAFNQMGSFGVSDLSVQNNSPEWLAIYAHAGIEEGSQLGLVSQIAFNLGQHYPYVMGLYAVAQNYNHICKYF